MTNQEEGVKEVEKTPNEPMTSKETDPSEIAELDPLPVGKKDQLEKMEEEKVTESEDSSESTSDTSVHQTWEEDMIVDIRSCVQNILDNEEEDWNSYSKIILSTISRMTVLASSQYLGKKGLKKQQEEFQDNKKIDWKTEKMKFVLNAFKTKVEGDQTTGKENKNWEKEFKNFSSKKNMEQIVAQVFLKKTGKSLENMGEGTETKGQNHFPFYLPANHTWGTVKCNPEDEVTRRDIKNQVKLACGPMTLTVLHTVFGVFCDKEELKYRMKDLQVMQNILVKMGDLGTNAAIQWEQVCGMLMHNWNQLVALEHHPGMLNRTQVYQWAHSILILIHDHFPRDTWTEHKISKILGIAMLANHRNEELLKALHELLPNFLTLPDHIGHNMVINRHDPTQVESHAYQNWKNQQVTKSVSLLYNELEMAKDIWPIQAWVRDSQMDNSKHQLPNYSQQRPGNIRRYKSYDRTQW